MALSRYHEHTIELVAGSLPARDLAAFIARSLDEGGGHISVIDGRGREEVEVESGLLYRRRRLVATVAPQAAAALHEDDDDGGGDGFSTSSASGGDELDVIWDVLILFTRFHLIIP